MASKKDQVSRRGFARQGLVGAAGAAMAAGSGLAARDIQGTRLYKDVCYGRLHCITRKVMQA